MNMENGSSNAGVAAHEAEAVQDNSSHPALGHQLTRRGDVRKCPICGSAVDPDSYHCVKCRNYFCFHCRARLLPTDTQLECLSTGCEYYGKLICGICNPEHEKEEEPSVFAEPVDGYWPLWLIASIVLVSILAFWFTFWLDLVVGLLLFVGGGYWLHRVGFNIFGTQSMVTQSRLTSYRSCIACDKSVKTVRTER